MPLQVTATFRRCSLLEGRGNSMNGKGLVLGGGGVTGIAWMTGVLLGLQRSGVAILSADRFLGTSAGSTVAAQITSGVSLADLFEHQVNPKLQSAELKPAPHLLDLLMHSLPVLLHLLDPVERTRRIGQLALETESIDEATRRASIAARLPVHHWPSHALATVAVNTETGEVKIFDRYSGVSLVDAVAASCAVPGIWPPVTIGDARFMDGGIRSSDNVDLASDCAKIIVLSPLGGQGPTLPGMSLATQVEGRQRAGRETFVIEPNDEVRQQMGSNPFDASRRGPTAQAGLNQGKALADSVKDFWL